MKGALQARATEAASSWPSYIFAWIMPGSVLWLICIMLGSVLWLICIMPGSVLLLIDHVSSAGIYSHLLRA